MSAGRMHLPADLGGRVQKHMPKPYSRPSITIGGADGPRREWKWISACDIEVGDTVPGIGVVSHVDETITVPGEDQPMQDVQTAADGFAWRVEIRNDMVGMTRVFDGEDRVWVFSA